MTDPRRCNWCGDVFTSHRPEAVYCCDRCRHKAYEKRKGIAVDSKPRKKNPAKGGAKKRNIGDPLAPMPNHGTWQRYRQNKCRCSRCTIAEAAYRKQLRSLAEERIPDDPRVCEHCPGEVRFPTKAAKHQHVRVEHPITRTPVTSDKTPNVFDLPTLDMRSW